MNKIGQNVTSPNDLIVNTINNQSPPQNRLRAVILYARGVKEDFPETTTWMNNIILLAGGDPT